MATHAARPYDCCCFSPGDPHCHRRVPTCGICDLQKIIPAKFCLFFKKSGPGSCLLSKITPVIRTATPNRMDGSDEKADIGEKPKTKVIS